MAYIFGAKLENKDLRLYLERKWKVNCDYHLQMENIDPHVWARDAGNITINQEIQCGRFIISENDLKLVLLFRYC